MKNFKFYTKQTIDHLISRRKGETKLGEKLGFADDLENLEKSSCEYVLFGIPEDIGVRANYGKPGTSAAWKAFLAAFLNIQANRFNPSENCLLLGEVDCENWMEQAAQIETTDPEYHEKLGALVSEIDETVSAVVEQIVAAGKTPVVIGGGHNNAYGIIKGAAAALKKPINVLNIDAHTDLREPEYRHSGNGFRYALKEGFLEKYSVFGLHENYTSEPIFEHLENSENLHVRVFETMLPFSLQEKITELQKSCGFLGTDSFGLELDCDALGNFDSSAKTPSGFSLNETRVFLRELKKHRPQYLHLCEAAANGNSLTGKSLAYLVGDFVA